MLNDVLLGSVNIISQHEMQRLNYIDYYKNILNQIGLRQFKFHALRHSFASRCIESRCDYKTLSSILGHSSVNTTLNIYVHPSNEQKKKCIDKMLKQVL
jgi:integrase